MKKRKAEMLKWGIGKHGEGGSQKEEGLGKS
jgi:hypothetical protein